MKVKIAKKIAPDCEVTSRLFCLPMSHKKTTSLYGLNFFKVSDCHVRTTGSFVCCLIIVAILKLEIKYKYLFQNLTIFTYISHDTANKFQAFENKIVA